MAAAGKARAAAAAAAEREAEEADASSADEGQSGEDSSGGGKDSSPERSGGRGRDDPSPSKDSDGLPSKVGRQLGGVWRAGRLASCRFVVFWHFYITFGLICCPVPTPSFIPLSYVQVCVHSYGLDSIVIENAL